MMSVEVQQQSRLTAVFLRKATKKSTEGAASPRSYASYDVADTPSSTANKAFSKFGKSMLSQYVLRTLAIRSP